MSASLQPILALLGYPVAGNPLQYMIEKALAQRELDWRYLSLEVAPDDLSDALRGMRVMGFLGGSCAQPHQSAILPLLDQLGRTAELSGLVNCFRSDSGKWIGENTEGQALLQSLRLRLEPEGKHVVLFGGGPWARAVAVELATAKVAGLTVVDVGEPSANGLADLLAERLECAAAVVPSQQPFSLPPETEILINAAAGGDDSETTVDLDLESLKPEMLVADRILSPPETWLIREAEQRGCATIDGLEIFVTQVAIDFRLWTGIDPDISVLREAVEEYLEL